MNKNVRRADYPIDSIFVERWSPRAFTTEPLMLERLFAILETARWAASSFNTQPWRFIYGLRGTPQWETVLGLLVPFNQEWAKHAAALVFAVSKTTSRSPKTGEEHRLPTHSFYRGASCAYMTLQTLKLGWHAHGILGFDHERAREALPVAVEVAFAIGRRGDPSRLNEALRTREKPSDRLPRAELAFEGHM